MGVLDMEWISANLTNMMGAYSWIILGTVIGTAAILSGLVASIAERLEDAHGTLVFQAARRYRFNPRREWVWTVDFDMPRSSPTSDIDH